MGRCWSRLSVRWLAKVFVLFPSLSWGVPPLLPGCKPFLFLSLRGDIACKNVITKGLPPNISKQTS
jgi:hypothetical protein